MAIVTDRTVTRGGLSIGISKSITQLMSDNDFTVENLTPYMFAGQLDRISNRGYSTSSSYSEGSAAQQIASGVSPLVPRTSLDAAVFAGWIGSMGETTEFYGRNILLYTDSGWSGTNQHLRSDDGMSGMYVVTDVNIKKLYFNTGNTSTTINAVTGDETSATFRNISGAEVLNRDNNESVAIAVYTILIDGNNNWYLYRPDVFPYNERTLSNNRLGSGWDSAPTSFHKEGNVGFGRVTIPNPLPDFETHTNYLVNYASDGGDFPIDPDTIANYGSGTSYFIYSTSSAAYTIFLYTPYAWGSRCIEKDEAVFIQQLANAGLYFKYDNTMYKPLASGGFLDGYTTDMTQESDWDDITNVTGNTVPPAPPGPTPPGDDEDNNDPISTKGAPFSAGLCHYYALTAGSVLLDHISEALGTWDIENTHKDLYKNLVSCKLIKPPAAIPTTGSEPFTIYGVKPQYQGADITLPVVTGNPDATFGPYTIDRKFGDFRDYAPYTRVSIFLPYCGWCDLPSHVVGRSVTVKYFTDIIAATCKAVVFCNNNIIAEAAGVIGLDIPFVADNVGAKMQAVTAGMIAALGGGIQLGAGIGTMVSTKSGSGAKAALSGASQYLSGYSQMAMAFNENTTEISGKNGDGCCLSGATNIIIKIVRPKKGAYTTAPFTPPGYGHNVGFVSQKQVKVSRVSGLLIADNVDTSGISGATEAERAEIKRVLETGLIVNAAPE